MKRTLIPGLAICLALCVGTSVSALQANLSDAVLGANGIVYTVSAGEYGALFPESSATAAEHHVLALSISDSLGGTTQQVVPGTEGYEIEVNPSVLFEESTGTLYLLWESWYGVHSRLHLAGLSDDVWTDITEITGSPYVVQSSPHFAVTRDQVIESEADGITESVHQRTILHLFWIEERGAGEEMIAYAPQLLLDGEFVASGQRVVLNDLLPATSPAAAAAGYPLDAPLLNVQPGEDPQSVVVVFSDAPSQTLTSLEMRVLPGEISFLADRLQELIASQPDSVTASAASLSQLADVAADDVSENGASLQPVVRRELADKIRTFVEGQEPGDSPQALADAGREHLLEAGADLSESGIQYITGRRRPHWIDLGYQPPGGKPGGEDTRSSRSYQVVSQVAAQAPAPQAILEQGVELMVSKDGEDLVLVWQQGDTLFYQERDADSETGWSRTNRLSLNDDFGLEAARVLLQNRIDKR